MSLNSVAQEIIQHASKGPGQRPGELVLNSLSPHLERFIVECVRKHLIQETQGVQEVVLKELLALRNLFPEPLQGQVELSTARINAFIQSIYK